MQLRPCLLALAFFAAIAQPSWAAPARHLESLSPDRQFGFRATGSDEDGHAYNLVRRSTGKVLAKVAYTDADAGPSSRFIMKVLWRPDSKAFALTAMIWKRGSYVAVYRRGSGPFHEIKLPELEAEIPDSVKAGNSYPHFSELNSQSAKRWQKNGSLVVEIENAQDGDAGTITAFRTVTLAFGKSSEARIVKSAIKFSKTN